LFTVIGGCPVPHIINGNIVQKAGGFMPGDTAIVSCNSQYVLIPKNVRPLILCNKDGSWSGEQTELPTCAGMKYIGLLVNACMVA
jgi:Sushi repeat (SCR repeat)